ncbi:MAG: S-layer homology domain-containing protein [Crinalium sp.]
MFSLDRWSSKDVALLTMGLTFATIAPWIIPTSEPVFAAPNSQTSFPDIDNHWAKPFIERLVAENILVGYPDGTFRPNQAMDRDEFAAVIRKAFNQNQVRNITAGSTFDDVPSGYWAAPAIKEAYETGFMQANPNGSFRPEEKVSRFKAISILTKALNNGSTLATGSINQVTNQPSTYPVNRRRAKKNKLSIPLAFTALMHPVFMQPANAQNSTKNVANNQGQPTGGTASSVPTDKMASTNRPDKFDLSKYYQDADRIPQNAIDDVTAATKANIVVNYPNIRMLKPQQFASRGDIAALTYQTLVKQGRMQPIDSNLEAANYIVGRNNTPASNKKTTQNAQ